MTTVHGEHKTEFRESSGPFVSTDDFEFKSSQGGSHLYRNPRHFSHSENSTQFPGEHFPPPRDVYPGSEERQFFQRQNSLEATERAHEREETMQLLEYGSHFHQQEQSQLKDEDVSANVGNTLNNYCRIDTQDEEMSKSKNIVSPKMHAGHAVGARDGKITHNASPYGKSDAYRTLDNERKKDTGEAHALSFETLSAKLAPDNQPKKGMDKTQAPFENTAAKSVQDNDPNQDNGEKQTVSMEVTLNTSKRIPAIAKLNSIPTSECSKRQWGVNHDILMSARKTSVFILKTFQMIKGCDPNFCCWNDNGDMFIVKDHAKLTEFHISKFFNHSNFSSFVRQLNFYGFQKIFSKDAFDQTALASKKKSAAYTGFYHKDFHRDHPETLKFIRRVTAMKGSAATCEKENREKEIKLDEFEQQISKMKNRIFLMENKLNSKIDSVHFDFEPKIKKVCMLNDAKINRIVSHYDEKINEISVFYDKKISKLASQFHMRIAHTMMQIQDVQGDIGENSPPPVVSLSTWADAPLSQELESESERAHSYSKNN